MHTPTTTERYTTQPLPSTTAHVVVDNQHNQEPIGPNFPTPDAVQRYTTLLNNQKHQHI